MACITIRGIETELIATRYLGDSVYVGQEAGYRGIWLWLDNGDGPYNEIFLEPAVAVALIQFMRPRQ